MPRKKKPLPPSPFVSESFIRIHGQCPEKWAKRWDLESVTYPCNLCGEPMTTTIPFFAGQFRGLIAPNCKCGNDRPPYCLIRDPKYGDLFSGG